MRKLKITSEYFGCAGGVAINKHKQCCGYVGVLTLDFDRLSLFSADEVSKLTVLGGEMTRNFFKNLNSAAAVLSQIQKNRTGVLSFAHQ